MLSKLWAILLSSLCHSKTAFVSFTQILEYKMASYFCHWKRLSKLKKKLSVQGDMAIRALYSSMENVNDKDMVDHGWACIHPLIMTEACEC
jgi:hypothetical protein